MSQDSKIKSAAELHFKTMILKSQEKLLLQQLDQLVSLPKLAEPEPAAHFSLPISKNYENSLLNSHLKKLEKLCQDQEFHQRFHQLHHYKMAKKNILEAVKLKNQAQSMGFAALDLSRPSDAAMDQSVYYDANQFDSHHGSVLDQDLDLESNHDLISFDEPLESVDYGNPFEYQSGHRRKQITIKALLHLKSVMTESLAALIKEKRPDMIPDEEIKSLKIELVWLPHLTQ
jgi:hypothetical protein